MKKLKIATTANLNSDLSRSRKVFNEVNKAMPKAHKELSQIDSLMKRAEKVSSTDSKEVSSLLEEFESFNYTHIDKLIRNLETLRDDSQDIIVGLSDLET